MKNADEFGLFHRQGQNGPSGLVLLRVEGSNSLKHDYQP